VLNTPDHIIVSIDSAILLACCATAVASLVGGGFAMWFGLTHRRMQVLLSVVAGAMAGIAVLDLLPHAIEALLAAAEPACDSHDHHGHDHAVAGSVRDAMLWMVGGFLAMYLLERFVCFHHHESGGAACCGEASGHAVSWLGASAGLSVHAVLAGLGLGAATVLDGGQGLSWPGGALLIAILMHKPFDGLAIVSLMRRDGRSTGAVWLVNGAYALVTPVGVLIAWFWASGAAEASWAAPAVAATAGILLCIALADLLPELQTHAHDKLLLTSSLLVGLAIAAAAAFLH